MLKLLTCKQDSHAYMTAVTSQSRNGCGTRQIGQDGQKSEHGSNVRDRGERRAGDMSAETGQHESLVGIRQPGHERPRWPGNKRPRWPEDDS